jgi:Domain of unknown function (DUF4384)
MTAVAALARQSRRFAVAAVVWLIGANLQAGLGAEPSLEDDRAAAAAGDPEALVRLAERYETADGVPFDLRATSTILHLAAERGHAAAQYRLGLLQAGGLDPEGDAAEAYAWLQLAARNAKDAPTGLLAQAISEALANRLDQEAIERAEQRVAAFRPTTGPADLPTVTGDARPDDDPATLAALLPTTGCGPPEIQRREDGGVLVVAYAPSGPAVGVAIAPSVEADLARRGADLDIAGLSPAICAIREVAAAAAIERPAAGVSLVGTGNDSRVLLRDGDELVIDVAAASKPRYVAVDYAVHTGDVWHLYPGPGEDGFLPAGQSLRLGDGADGPAWTVGAPFGEDLVLVTLSAEPFGMDQPAAEAAEAFQARLQRRLEAAPADGSLRLFERVVVTQAQ